MVEFLYHIQNNVQPFSVASCKPLPAGTLDTDECVSACKFVPYQSRNCRTPGEPFLLCSCVAFSCYTRSTALAARAPLTLAEKEHLYAAKIQGRSLPSIAAELGCSPETARKWWRLARDHGRAAFQVAWRGRAATGVLSRFSAAVTSRALALKREHPTWGPDRVLTDLQHDPTLTELPLPSRSRLALLFKTECPELVAPRRTRSSPPSAPRGSGKIINVTTVVAQKGAAGTALYGATKAALTLLTKAWADEFGPSGVNVNALVPHLIRTPGTEEQLEDLEQIARSLPARRYALPEEVARAALYLASDEASYIHGVALPVDGGYLAV